MRKFFVALLFAPLLVACGAEEPDDVIERVHTDSPAINLNDGTYLIDTEASSLHWTAYKVASSHEGNVSIKKGEVTFEDKLPVSGSFVVDMNTITNTDIEDEESNASLIEHLKSEDFFSVSDFPEATFEITSASVEAAGDYDFKIQGDLTIKDVTEPATFMAKVDQKNPLKVHATTTIDRTKFGMTFNSGSFFENLGDKTIKDGFTLAVDLVFN